jgi:molybdopterin/thiamine biosynthesis adenylyltransferase
MGDLLARVRPLVGDALEGRQVAVIGSPAAGTLVQYLVECGVRRFVTLAGNEWLAALVEELAGRYGGFDISYKAVARDEELGAAYLALVVDDVELALRLPVNLPRLLALTPTLMRPATSLLALPGEAFDNELYADMPRCVRGFTQSFTQCGSQNTLDWLTSDWLTAAPLMALLARAVLLRATPSAMATWEEAWAQGQRIYVGGDALDPTQPSWVKQCTRGENALPPFRTPVRRQGTLLIAGLGSLGSVAASQLAPFVERLILVDPDEVEEANLVRQNYAHHQVGMAKATALSATLCAATPHLVCEPIVTQLTDETQVATLIRRFGVTAALVTTGTVADFAIARALHAAAIPHVVGRCYARARFWEGIVVEGGGITPSYEQMRRGVLLGPAPAPTPEEVAAYGAVGELAGEPASSMETGWAAMWLARLTVQMMAPATMREGWLWARLAAGATCFVGGVVVEPAMDGSSGGVMTAPAYGIAMPGEVHAWSVAEIAV